MREDALRQIVRVEVRGRGLASRCRSLVRRHGRIALNQLDPAERHAQFFRNQLRLHREHALSKIALSRIRGDRPVGRHGYPGIKLFGINMGRMRIERALRQSERRGQLRRAETHNQRARSPQKREPSTALWWIGSDSIRTTRSILKRSPSRTPRRRASSFPPA